MGWVIPTGFRSDGESSTRPHLSHAPFAADTASLSRADAFRRSQLHVDPLQVASSRVCHLLENLSTKHHSPYEGRYVAPSNQKCC